MSATAEQLLETTDVSVRRLNGRARDGVDGRHKRLVIYVSSTVGDAELARPLHDTACRIERSSPRVES